MLSYIGSEIETPLQKTARATSSVYPLESHRNIVVIFTSSITKMILLNAQNEWKLYA